MGEQSLETYKNIVDFMSRASESIVDDNAWYLSIVGVLPKFQGQGLGKELVLEVLKKTDALDLPTYLETFTARNKSFYRRLGYVEVAEVYEPNTASDYWIMVRLAKGQT